MSVYLQGTLILTVISELVKLPEVFSVQMQRDFETFAIVFRGKEELYDNFLGDFTLDVDLNAERFVVEARVLDNNADVVI